MQSNIENQRSCQLMREAVHDGVWWHGPMEPWTLITASDTLEQEWPALCQATSFMEHPCSPFPLLSTTYDRLNGCCHLLWGTART